MEKDEKEQEEAQIQRRANRHLIILYVAMSLMILLPAVLYIFFFKEQG